MNHCTVEHLTFTR